MSLIWACEISHCVSPSDRLEKVFQICKDRGIEKLRADQNFNLIHQKVISITNLFHIIIESRKYVKQNEQRKKIIYSSSYIMNPHLHWRCPIEQENGALLLINIKTQSPISTKNNNVATEKSISIINETKRKDKAQKRQRRSYIYEKGLKKKNKLEVKQVHLSR